MKGSVVREVVIIGRVVGVGVVDVVDVVVVVGVVNVKGIGGARRRALERGGLLKRDEQQVEVRKTRR